MRMWAWGQKLMCVGRGPIDRRKKENYPRHEEIMEDEARNRGSVVSPVPLT